MGREREREEDGASKEEIQHKDTVNDGSKIRILPHVKMENQARNTRAKEEEKKSRRMNDMEYESME